jgi:hypothetical protein
MTYYLLGFRDDETPPVAGYVSPGATTVCLLSQPVVACAVANVVARMAEELGVSVVLVCTRPPSVFEVESVAHTPENLIAQEWVVGAIEPATGRAYLKYPLEHGAPAPEPATEWN